MYRHFWAGMKTALPAAISLIPLGISMGLISSQAGLNWLQTGLLSALMMSGSAQIAAMGISAKTPKELCSYYSDVLGTLISDEKYGPAILNWAIT